MTPDMAAHDGDGGRDTFTPTTVSDRFKRRVRDDHAPNAALHATLQAAFAGLDSFDVDLMASHAPGEKDHDPTYDVWVECRNEGAGHPALPRTVQRLIDTDDAVVTKVVECGDDHLIVAVRAVETRVEPVEIRYDDLPDDVVECETVENRMRQLLSDIDHEDGTPPLAVYEVARSFGYLLSMDFYGPDKNMRDLRDLLLEDAGIDPDDLSDKVEGGEGPIGVPVVAAFLGDVDTRLHEELRSSAPLRIFRDVVDDYDHAFPDPDRDGAGDRLQPRKVRLADFPDGWRDEKIGPVDATAPPATLLERVEELAEDDDSTLGYGDILTVVSNNRSREWINDHIVDPEGGADHPFEDDHPLVVNADEVADDLSELQEDLRSRGNTMGEDLGADAHRAADRVKELREKYDPDVGGGE